jgi:hypothetical protein
MKIKNVTTRNYYTTILYKDWKGKPFTDNPSDKE